MSVPRIMDVGCRYDGVKLTTDELLGKGATAGHNKNKGERYGGQIKNNYQNEQKQQSPKSFKARTN